MINSSKNNNNTNLQKTPFPQVPSSIPNSNIPNPHFNPLLNTKLPFPPSLLFKPGMPPGMPPILPPGMPNPFSKLPNSNILPTSNPNLNISNLTESSRTSTKVHHHCRVCGKEFRASSLLDIHMRTHVGAKPFRCDRCPHRASQKGNLKMHMKKHHGVELPHHLDALPDAGIWCLMKPEQLQEIQGEDGGPRRGVIPESELLEQKVIRVIRRIQNKFGQASLTRPSDSLEDFLKLAEESLLRDGMKLDEAMRPPSPPIVVIQQSSNGNEGRTRKRNESSKMDLNFGMSKSIKSSLEDLSFPGLKLPSKSPENGIKSEFNAIGSPRLQTPPSPLTTKPIFPNPIPNLMNRNNMNDIMNTLKQSINNSKPTPSFPNTNNQLKTPVTAGSTANLLNQHKLQNNLGALGVPPTLMNPEMIMRALNQSRKINNNSNNNSNSSNTQAAMAAQLAKMAKPHQKLTE